jgi:hypothetical protein
MDAETRARSRAQSLDEIWKWTVGAGILLVALAPLALPILILTIVATLPLLVPLLALGLLAGAIALLVMLFGRASRSLSQIRPRRRRSARPSPERRPEPPPGRATGHQA